MRTFYNYNKGTIIINPYVNACNSFELNKKPIFVTNGLIQHLIGGVGVVGNVWEDQSGNNKDGILFNNPVINLDSIELDGISSYVNLGIANRDNYTLSLKIEFITYVNNDRFISNITNISNTLGVSYYGNKLGVAAGVFGANFQLLTEYTFDLVSKNNNLYLYTNGVLISVLNNTAYRKFTLLGLGNRYRGLYGTTANIKIKDWKYYTRDLTDSEITQNYNS